MPLRLDTTRRFVSRREPAACSMTRPEAERHRADVLAALTRAVAKASSVRLVDPIGQLCDARLFRAERGEAIVYTDTNHLSATGARLLAPWFSETAAWLGGLAYVADAELRR